MATNQELRAAFVHTYAGHVFNSIHGAMSADLVRNIGALILDNTKRAASLWRAVEALRKQRVAEELRTTAYEVIPPADANPAVSAAVQNLSRTEFKGIFANLPAELAAIDRTVFKASIAEVIEEVRNKMVAHVAVESDGSDWKVWTVDGGKLTYPQLDAYIDVCTDAIEKITARVLRVSFAFDDLPAMNRRYVDEYIAALLVGLAQQKQDRERRLQDITRQMQNLITGASKPPENK